MSQLNELERQFEMFLFEKAGYKISRDGREYFQNARTLLIKIIESDTNQEISYNIMNFNYTDPWSSRWEENYKSLSTGFKKPDGFISVHGQALDREDGVNRIIFGIDNSNISPENSSYLFTKTFRTLVNYSDNQKPLDAVNQNVFDTNIRLIKFFGHSLGEADYSYFQQMFDYYNLYENNQLKLIFYLKKYDDRDSMEYLQEQSQIVTKLIEKYGETLDNKNHGKNLLTRLEMTKRIFIKEIK